MPASLPLQLWKIIPKSLFELKSFKSKHSLRVEDESVWMTQAQMAELFQTSRNNITLHTRNIFKEGELIENSVSKDSLLTAKDGKKYRTKLYYGL